MRIIKILINAGANIDVIEDSNYYFDGTCLQAAAFGEDKELVKLLIHMGANVNALPNVRCGMTALQAAAGPASYDKSYPSLPEVRHRIVRHLLAAGADINAPPSYSGGMTAL